MLLFTLAVKHQAPEADESVYDAAINLIILRISLPPINKPCQYYCNLEYSRLVAHPLHLVLIIHSSVMCKQIRNYAC